MSDAAYGYATNPYAQELAAFAAAESSPNAFSQSLGNIGGQYGLGIANAEAQALGAAGQYAYNQASIGLGDTYAQQQAAYQLSSLGITGQQYGIQSLDNAEQQQLLGVTSALEQQQYGVQSQQYPQELEQAAIEHGTNVENLQGNLASTGALNTKGSGEQQAQLQAEYGFQVSGIERQAEVAQLQQAGTLAQQAYSQEDLQNSAANIGLMAEQNGLSEQQVYNQLNYTLAQSGLSSQLNPLQFVSQLEGYLSGQEQALGPGLAQALLQSGLNVVAPASK